MARATFLLPAAERFGGQQAGADVARMLGRADRAQSGDDGRRAQLRRHFRLTPDHWPMAALTRQMDAGDAAGAAWLRADPSYVRPDINGARRSEEHTSELQSLMRHSYAVFCLEKKTTQTNNE